MANFLRSVLVQNRAEAADRVFTEDLPVNPLTQILVTLRGVVTESDTVAPLADILALMPAVGVSFRGQDLVRGSLADLAMVNAIVCGSRPWGTLPQVSDAGTFAVTVPITFGRRPYLVKECLPAVRRGDLVLECQVDTLVTNVDLVSVQIETVELLDETPEAYLKYTTAAHTFSGTGEEDVRLPIGNPLVGVLLAGTTVPTTTATTATWERLRLRVDNVEALYARANWDSLHGELGRQVGGDLSFLMDHVHRANGAAAAFADTTAALRGAALSELYAYLDFDPLGDGMYLLETAGRADVVIHRDAGTADLGRFLPIELVPVRGAGS